MGWAGLNFEPTAATVSSVRLVPPPAIGELIDATGVGKLVAQLAT